MLFRSERTTVKPSLKSDAGKQRHWQRIIISACEQCGRATLPMLHDPMDLSCLENVPGDKYGFILDTESNKTFEEFGHKGLTSIWLLVGPEGGLMRSEVDAMQQKGYQAVGLGPRTLRTETAALSAVICAQLLWGDLSARQKQRVKATSINSDCHSRGIRLCP